MRFSEVCIGRPLAASMLSSVALLLAAHRPGIGAERPTVTVSVEYPGTSADAMAVSIAAPLERRFSTITGVSSIGSTNTAGHSTITVEFDGGRDIDAAIIEVRSAVSEVSLPRDLPAGPVVARGGRR